MEFLVIAHDHTDDGALVRRLVDKERHLAAARRTIESGNLLTGRAILDKEGRMAGSMTVVSFPDRAAFDDWLQGMPYMKNNAWKRIKVYPCHVSVDAWPEARPESTRSMNRSNTEDRSSHGHHPRH